MKRASSFSPPEEPHTHRKNKKKEKHDADATSCLRRVLIQFLGTICLVCWSDLLYFEVKFFRCRDPRIRLLMLIESISLQELIKLFFFFRKPYRL